MPSVAPAQTLAQAVRSRPAATDRLALLARVADVARLLAASDRPLDTGALSADRVVLAGPSTLVRIEERSDAEVEPRLLGDDGEPSDRDRRDQDAVAALGGLIDEVLTGIDIPAPVQAVAERANRRAGEPFADLGQLAAALDQVIPADLADPSAQRRRRARVRLIAVGLVAVLAVAALIVLWQYERSQGQSAARSAQAARSQQRASNRLLVAAMIGKAESLADDGYFTTAALFAASAIEMLDQYAHDWPDEQALRQDASSHLLRLSLEPSYLLARDYAREHPISDMDASADGSIVAMAGGTTTIGVVKSGATRIDRFPGHQQRTERVAVSADGEWMVSAGDAGELIAWRPAARKLARRLRSSGSPIRDLAILSSPTSRLAAAASADGRVAIFDLDSGAETLLTSQPGEASVVAISPSQPLLAAASPSGVIGLWDLRSQVQVGQLLGHSGPIRQLQFAGSAARLLSAGSDGTVRIWDVDRRIAVGAPLASTDMASAALSADGMVVALGSRDGSLRLWNGLDGRLIVALHGHRAAVIAAIFATGESDSDNRLISASSSGHLRIWTQKADRGGARTISRPEEFGPALALAPGGEEIAVSDGERTLLRFNRETGAALAPLVGHVAQVSEVAYSPDGKLMATAAVDGDARLWRRDSATPLMALTGHEGGIEDLAFSPDSSLLLTAGVDGTIRIWQAQSGEQQLMLRQHKGPVGAVAFDASGDLMASAGWDGTIHIWQRVSRHRYKQRTTIEGQRRWFAVALSADGGRLVAGGEQGWHLYTSAGALIAAVDQHGATVADVELAGELIATAGHDGTARLWRLSDQQLLARLSTDPAQVELGPDGAHMAWPHGRHLRITSIDLGILDRPGSELLRAAETRGGIIRRGFAIEHVSTGN